MAAPPSPMVTARRIIVEAAAIEASSRAGELPSRPVERDSDELVRREGRSEVDLGPPRGLDGRDLAAVEEEPHLPHLARDVQLDVHGAEDEAEARWQARLAQAREQVRALQQAPHLSEPQRQEAVEGWITSHFDAREQLRVRALLGL